VLVLVGLPRFSLSVLRMDGCIGAVCVLEDLGVVRTASRFGIHQDLCDHLQFDCVALGSAVTVVDIYTCLSACLFRLTVSYAWRKEIHRFV
jgi:hypothetical protein